MTSAPAGNKTGVGKEGHTSVPHVRGDKPTRAAIFDIDGVLADCSQVKVALTTSISLDEYYENLCARAKVDELAKALLFSGAHHVEFIIFLTARTESMRRATVRWLERFYQKEYLLFMAPDDDKSSPAEFKKNTYRKSIKDHYDVAYAVDDDLTNHMMWQGEDVPSLLFQRGTLHSKKRRIS